MHRRIFHVARVATAAMLAACMHHVPPAPTPPQAPSTTSGQITVAGVFDGHSRIYVRGGELQVWNLSGDVPDTPLTIDGETWAPGFPSTRCECWSGRFFNIRPPLPSVPIEAYVDWTAGRTTPHVITPAQPGEVIVDVDDSQPGRDRYVFTIRWQVAR